MTEQIREQATIDDFMTFIEQSENRDRIFEFIDGEIIAVPSNGYVSVIAGLILFAIRQWIITSGQKGHVTGADGGFIIEGHVLAPDVAYVHDLPAKRGFEQTPPVLAVEVISDPTNSTEQTDLRRKLATYKRAGVAVWVVDYVAEQVDVHLPNGDFILYAVTDTISGGDVLPGFDLPIAEIFPKMDEPSD